MTSLPREESPAREGRGVGLLLVFVLIGAAVSVGLGVFGKYHAPATAPTLGFADLVTMKVTLASVTGGLGLVQVLTALRMYGRIGHGQASRGVSLAHRISGVAAVVVSLPVAFACLWALGFGTYSPRVVAHSLAGCAFYGVFVAKMLTLRSSRVPAWALPLLGGLLFTVLVVIWLTSAMWVFAGGGPGY
ncbi:MAG TPA: DUF6529 family protein [Propionibacteriaceae bacterium]|nr:DUF6529 family protein [Propionibacteriaceae bacterium]